MIFHTNYIKASSRLFVNSLARRTDARPNNQSNLELLVTNSIATTTESRAADSDARRRRKEAHLSRSFGDGNMAYTRRYAPPGASASSASRAARSLTTRLPFLIIVVIAFFLSRAVVGAIGRAGTRALELDRASEALSAYKERARELEGELKKLSELRVELETHKREAAETKKTLERVRDEKEAAEQVAKDAQKEVTTLTEVREERTLVAEAADEAVKLTASALGRKSNESMGTTVSDGRASISRANTFRTTSDSDEDAEVVDVVEEEENKEEDARTETAFERDTETSSEVVDAAPSVDASSKDSATYSDPLLINIAKASAASSAADVDMTCNGKKNTELWGSVVKSGDRNEQPDAGACCDSCAQMNANGANRCSTWVYGEQNKQCWLKYEENPEKSKPANSGVGVQWTSGYFKLPSNIQEVKYKPATGKTDMPKCLHTIMTSNGNVYMNWQSRVMYASYLRHAKEPGSIMKAFTRILHKGRADELMHEIPTIRFNPVQTKCDGWCDYPVADRSQAVTDWLQTADSERCSHIVMVETDHIIVKSPSPEILLPVGQAMGFKFGYMSPTQRTIKRLYPQYFEGGAKMPPTGNAPSVVNTVDLRKIAPLWAKFVNETEQPEAVRKDLGWVRDMYAYDLAALASGVEHKLDISPNSLLMAQPPADTELGNAYILHYTWGPEIYDKENKLLWKFDKRSYGDGQFGEGPAVLKEIPLPPEWDESTGLQLQDFFQPRGLNEKRLGLIRTLIEEFNFAVRSLPEVPKGYATMEEARADV